METSTQSEGSPERIGLPSLRETLGLMRLVSYCDAHINIATNAAYDSDDASYTLHRTISYNLLLTLLTLSEPDARGALYLFRI